MRISSDDHVDTPSLKDLTFGPAKGSSNNFHYANLDLNGLIDICYRIDVVSLEKIQIAEGSFHSSRELKLDRMIVRLLLTRFK